MHSPSRATSRLLAVLALLGATSMQAAQAQYFNQDPSTFWRTTAGIHTDSQTKAKIQPKSSDPLALDSMSEASAVRVACGVSTNDAVLNLSGGFTTLVGVAWGLTLLVIALIPLKTMGKPNLKTLVRGSAIIGAACATPFLVSAMPVLTSIQFLAALGLIGGMLTFIWCTSPQPKETAKRIGKGLAVFAAAIMIGTGWLWVQSEISTLTYKPIAPEDEARVTTPALPALRANPAPTAPSAFHL
jgi:hypothetical protein